MSVFPIWLKKIHDSWKFLPIEEVEEIKQVEEKMNLSKNLTLEEAITSQSALRLKIDNTPTPEVLVRMELISKEVFQKVREHFNKPIRVSSFYRCPKLNKAIGGSKTSQHMTGEAIDIQGTNGLSNSEIFEYIKNNLEFDQLIWEYGTTSNPAWGHVSYVSKERGRNRKRVFSIGVKNKKF